MFSHNCSSNSSLRFSADHSPAPSADGMLHSKPGQEQANCSDRAQRAAVYESHRRGQPENGSGYGYRYYDYDDYRYEYRYEDGLVVYNHRSGVVVPIHDAGEMERYLDRYNHTRDNGCPFGWPGNGETILPRPLQGG